MANTVIALRSSGSTGATPSLGVVANGELSLNFADGILYYKTTANTLGQIKTTPVAGLDTEVQFNDGGNFGSSSSLTFNKTAGRITTTNVTAGSVASQNYVQFGDGTKQYSANAGSTQTFNTIAANGTNLVADSTTDTLTITSAIANGIFITGTSGTDTIDLGLLDTGVTATGYGTSIAIPALVVDAKGRLTSVSNTTIRSGSTSQTGVVQLEDSVTSTSTSLAATSNAVKTAYDHANSAYAAANTASAEPNALAFAIALG